MGFYSAPQLVQDAKRHGVEVRPIDVSYSDYDCSLEGLPARPAVRLGLRMIDKLRTESALRIVAERMATPFDSAEELSIRAGLELREMQLLAAADALRSLSGHRRQHVWDATALRSRPALLREAPAQEDLLELPPAPEAEEVVFDYATLGLTLRKHPLELLRPTLLKRRLLSSKDLAALPGGRKVSYVGLVTLRQQPSTANGTIFVSLEDEQGPVQAIVSKSVRDRDRDTLLNSRLLVVHGVWQREGDVRMEDLTPLLGGLAATTASRDFH